MVDPVVPQVTTATVAPAVTVQPGDPAQTVSVITVVTGPDMRPWYHRVTFGSLTVLWSYFLIFGSVMLELLFQFPDVALQYSLATYVKPEWIPAYTGVVATITILARLRSILWRNDRIDSYIQDREDPQQKGDHSDQLNR